MSSKGWMFKYPMLRRLSYGEITLQLSILMSTMLLSKPQLVRNLCGGLWVMMHGWMENLSPLSNNMVLWLSKHESSWAPYLLQVLHVTIPVIGCLERLAVAHNSFTCVILSIRRRHAHLVIYKACDYSDPSYVNKITFGAFSATWKGFFMSTPAGKEGPRSPSLSNGASWMLTVGASNIGRSWKLRWRIGYVWPCISPELNW